MTPQNEYGSVAKLLHWAIVVLLVAQFILGWTMPHIGRDTKPDTLIDLHFSFGTLILLLVLLRLAWRIGHPVASAAENFPLWQQRAATATHWLLYLLLLVILVLGWASASGRGFTISLFGLVSLPGILPVKSPLTGQIGDIHSALSTYGLLSLAGLHTLAALYHHFLLRDNTLRRMLPHR